MRKITDTQKWILKNMRKGCTITLSRGAYRIDGVPVSGGSFQNLIDAGLIQHKETGFGYFELTRPR